MEELEGRQTGRWMMGRLMDTQKYLNWMAALECIQIESIIKVGRCKLGPDIVLREAVVNTKVLDPRCKPFLQPKICPPVLFKTWPLQN